MNRDLSMRRRAIYTGLKPYLPTDQLSEMLDHWEQHYSDTPRFKLQGFVAEVCRRAGLNDRRADILLSLVQAMNMSAESLLREPGMDPAPPASERAGPEDVATFQSLLEAMIGQLDGDRVRQLRLDLLASLRGADTPAAVLEQIQGWLVDGQPMRPDGLTRPMLRALVNRAWILVTQYLGPVQADRLLHRASREAAAGSESAQQALGRLL